MPSLIDKLFHRKSKPVADEKIRYTKQQFEYDCGQACLTMLGYNGYSMFPKQEPVTEIEVAEIFGCTRNQILHFNGFDENDLDENTFFDTPHFLKVMRADEWGWHAVIGFKDQIYCPSLGIFKIPDYRRFIWGGSTTGFPVPFAEDNLHHRTGIENSLACNSL